MDDPHEGQRNEDQTVDSALPKSAHVCPDCYRSYKAAETLNRHRKNHGQRAQYACNSCDATFRRKDLLDRHGHIHQRSSTAGRRLKSLRACSRCKQMKVKCDGASPCSTCAKGRRECELEKNSPIQRLERDFRSSGDADTDMTDHRSLRASSQDDLAKIMDTSDFGPGVEADITVLEDFWSQTTAWPWLYEDLYMQSDPSWPSWTSEGETMIPTSKSQVENGLIPNDTRSSNVQLQAPANGSQSTSSQGGITFESGMDAAGSNIVNTPYLPSGCRGRVTGSVVEDLSTQQHVIDDLIATALTYVESGTNNSRTWQDASSTVVNVFKLHCVAIASSSSRHILEHFVKLYFEHFHPLWPLLWTQDIVLDLIPRHLYITLSAIGGVYAGKAAAAYHLRVFEALREQLPLVALGHKFPEEANTSLLQSLLLTQTTTLWFGHRKAFSTAQQLGGINVALARRMNIFTSMHRLGEQANTSVTFDSWRDSQLWIKDQTWKRLAFGMLRTDMFVSLLLGTPPLMSPEEILLEMPAPDSVWFHSHGALLPDSGLAHCDGFLYADLIHIALDRDEPLPPLRSEQIELLLFGLQQAVWRFSHDPHVTSRLGVSLSTSSRPLSQTQAHDPLFPHRQMHDLQADLNRLLAAIHKCHNALTIVIAPSASSSRQCRKTVLASHLLSHLSFMRLHADLPSLHLLTLTSSTPQTNALRETAQQTYTWAKTAEARSAAEHACMVWRLLNAELARPEERRASFTLLSHVALHHAAVVVWAFAGAHDQTSAVPTETELSLGSSTSEEEDLRLCKANSKSVMKQFIHLLDNIDPWWSSVSSYKKSMMAMSKSPLSSAQ